MAGGCGGAGRPVGYKNTPRPNEAYARISAKKNAPIRAAGLRRTANGQINTFFIMRKSVAHPFISFGLYWFYCKLSLAACQAWGSFVTFTHSLPGVNAASSSQVSSIALLLLPHAGKIAKSGLCPAIVSGLGRSVNGQKRPRYGRFRGFLNIFHKKRCLVKIDGPRTLYTSSGAL